MAKGVPVDPGTLRKRGQAGKRASPWSRTPACQSPAAERAFKAQRKKAPK